MKYMPERRGQTARYDGIILVIDIIIALHLRFGSKPTDKSKISICASDYKSCTIPGPSHVSGFSLASILPKRETNVIATHFRIPSDCTWHTQASPVNLP